MIGITLLHFGVSQSEPVLHIRVLHSHSEKRAHSKMALRDTPEPLLLVLAVSHMVLGTACIHTLLIARTWPKLLKELHWLHITWHSKTDIHTHLDA